MSNRTMPAPATLLCAVVGIVLCCGCESRSSEPDAERMLRSAVAYLWDQQGDDGGWHSSTHGIVSGGEAWTPFVAFYLLQVPDSLYATPQAQAEQALSFIRQHANDSGVLGLSDSLVLEYPNYATSYALRVLDRWGDPADSNVTGRMASYLEHQQFVEGRGIPPTHRAYGSWGFGETNLRLGEIGHIDLSHTRRVVEALHAHGSSGWSEAAQTYLRMLQKHPSEARPQPGAKGGDPGPTYDGGFYSSTTALGSNKAGREHPSGPDGPEGLWFFRSYATTTCDGLLAMLAADVDPLDERVLAAKQWLLDHDSLDTIPGIPPGSPGDWDRVLLYYHLLVRAEAYNALGVQGNDWRRRVKALLARSQRPDGSFSNPFGAPNKEDDPILATAMAVGAILNTLQ